MPLYPQNVRVPFLTNVMNNVMNTSSAGLLTQINATYPSMFPSGAPQPIFKYTCNTAAGPQPCPLVGSEGRASNIRDVDINLIVMTRPRPLKRRSFNLRIWRRRLPGHHDQVDVHIADITGHALASNQRTGLRSSSSIAGCT